MLVSMIQITSDKIILSTLTCKILCKSKWFHMSVSFWTLDIIDFILKLQHQINGKIVEKYKKNRDIWYQITL